MKFWSAFRHLALLRSALDLGLVLGTDVLRTNEALLTEIRVLQTIDRPL